MIISVEYAQISYNTCFVHLYGLNYLSLGSRKKISSISGPTTMRGVRALVVGSLVEELFCDFPYLLKETASVDILLKEMSSLSKRLRDILELFKIWSSMNRAV